MAGSVNLAIRCNSTVGPLLPLGKPNWLNWSCDKNDTIGLAYGSCHITLNPEPNP